MWWRDVGLSELVLSRLCGLPSCRLPGLSPGQTLPAFCRFPQQTIQVSGVSYSCVSIPASATFSQFHTSPSRGLLVGISTCRTLAEGHGVQKLPSSRNLGSRKRASEDPGTKYNPQGHSPSDLLCPAVVYLPMINTQWCIQIINSSNVLIYN